MKVLNALRYCMLAFFVLMLAVLVPTLVTMAIGGDVQQWKWFTVFYGGLCLFATTFFALLAAVWHAGLIITRTWQKAHG